MPMDLQTNPHATTWLFEQRLAKYTAAPFVACVNSCTMAITLALAWFIWGRHGLAGAHQINTAERVPVSMPRPGYLSVPQSVIHAGGWPDFRDEEWSGCYQLLPFPVWDSARRFTSGMYVAGQHQCVSFHASKTLGLEQGGAILHDDPAAQAWYERARFDGRTPGISPQDDAFTFVGFHCYINPSTAAQGLLRLWSFGQHHSNLPNDDYPDLSTLDLYKRPPTGNR